MALLCWLIGSGSPSERIPGLDLSFRDSGHDNDPDFPEPGHSITFTNPSLESVQEQYGAGTGRETCCSLLGSTSALTQPPCLNCWGVG